MTIDGVRPIRNASRQQATNVNANKAYALMSNWISVKILMNARSVIRATRTQFVKIQEVATVANATTPSSVTVKLVYGE